jgi:hypothetical protein
MNTVVLIISMAIYVRLFTKIKLTSILTAIFVCVTIVLFTEMIYGTWLFGVINLTYEEIFANPFLRAAFALPYELILLLLALGKNHYNKKKGLIAM